MSMDRWIYNILYTCTILIFIEFRGPNPKHGHYYILHVETDGITI